MDKIKKMWYSGDKKYEFIAILDFDKKELEKVRDEKYMNEFRKKIEYLNDNLEYKEFLTQEEDEQKRIHTFISIAQKHGKAEGLAEGLTKGKTEGINESKMEIAKNMLKEKMDITIISKLTGLTPKEIEKIS